MIVVRPARATDVDAVVDSEERNLGTDAWSRGLVEQGVAGALPTVVHLVAEDDGSLVGHAVASVVADVSELQRIAVHAEHRRRGIAALLLAEVEAAAHAGGAERLLLEVREDNEPARAFYMRHGFVEIDRRPRYYRDGATAVVMEKPLVGPEAKVWTTS